MVSLKSLNQFVENFTGTRIKNPSEQGELGDIISVFLHGDEDGQNFNQKIDQTYNIRGWLRKINNPTALEDDLFAFEIRYENPMTSGQISVDPNYNGNISQMLWNSKFDKPRAYGFTYDDLNRLTSTKYGDGISFNSSPDHFATSYSYDYNGNITSLVRKSNNIEITDFTYVYKNGGKSNQISYITDNNIPVSIPALKPLPYLYDANGSMYRDPSKQMSISYNHLNLPIGVLIGPDDEINYTYTHTGLKLRKTVETLNSAGDYTSDYCGNFLYRDNELITIFTPAGRIVPIEYAGETFWQYEYDMKDHLGNTRLVFAAHDNGHPEVLQQTSYYPYGKIMQQQNFQGTDANENKNLFNGKEFQDDVLAGINLDWYDFGARMYDPEICRWHVMDPLAVLSPNYSPYRFGFDNPIMFTDPSGMYEEDGEGGWPTRDEAREWADEKGYHTGMFGTCGIRKNDEGLFEIVNYLDQVVYSLYSEEDIAILGDSYHMQYDDNVGKEPLIMASDGNDGFNKDTDLDENEYFELRHSIYIAENGDGTPNWVERTGETADNFANHFAQIFVKVFPPTTLVDAPKTIFTGVDINNNAQEGAFNRYISPSISILGAVSFATTGSGLAIGINSNLSTANDGITIFNESYSRIFNK